jgi:hypothetical protein
MSSQNIGRELINTRDVINDQLVASLVESYSKDLSIDQIKQISLTLKSIVVTQFDGLIDRVAN